MRNKKVSYKELQNVKENLALIVKLKKPITNFLAYLNINYIGLSANTVTFLSVLLGFLSGYFFITNKLILGAIFFTFSRMADCVDGKTARFTNNTSRFGAFLDNYTGGLNFLMVIIGVTFGQFLVTNNISWLLISPFMIFLVVFPPLISSILVLKLGDKPSSIIKYNDFKNKKGFFNFIQKFQKKLFDLGLQEPYHSEDAYYLSFFFAPIFSYFFGYWLELILLFFGLLAIKQVFWFVYYRHLLVSKDKAEKNQFK